MYSHTQTSDGFGYHPISFILLHFIMLNNFCFCVKLDYDLMATATWGFTVHVIILELDDCTNYVRYLNYNCCFSHQQSQQKNVFKDWKDVKTLTWLCSVQSNSNSFWRSSLWRLSSLTSVFCRRRYSRSNHSARLRSGQRFQTNLGKT